MERTFIILKPDCMEQRNVGDIVSRFEANGFEIVAAKMTQLDPHLLEIHYAHIVDKPFYPEVVKFMTERPVLLLVLEATDAIHRARELIGPTNPEHALKSTIRGGFGTCTMRNVIHASDSREAARLEIARFFAETEIFHIEKPEAVI
ncbi:MAG: nucleoside-diphosphate kinase [Puniceicoccaceae bacterium]